MRRQGFCNYPTQRGKVLSEDLKETTLSCKTSDREVLWRGRRRPRQQVSQESRRPPLRTRTQSTTEEMRPSDPSQTFQEHLLSFSSFEKTKGPKCLPSIVQVQKGRILLPPCVLCSIKRWKHGNCLCGTTSGRLLGLR